jgi:hypothetical protein
MQHVRDTLWEEALRMLEQADSRPWRDDVGLFCSREVDIARAIPPAPSRRPFEVRHVHAMKHKASNNKFEKQRFADILRTILLSLNTL